MKTFAIKALLIACACSLTMPLAAGDATTALLERLDKGDCGPSSLTNKLWTITTGPVGTHGALNWGDRLVFEQQTTATRFFGSLTISYNDQSAFRVWKNGMEWKSSGGWNGACVRTANQTVYVLTGKVFLDGCLHELAFGRLDHDDTLGDRIEVIFEHAEEDTACAGGHVDAVRHPGHAHGDHD